MHHVRGTRVRTVWKTKISPFTYIFLTFSDANTESHPEFGLINDDRKEVCSHSVGTTVAVLEEHDVQLVEAVSRCLQKLTVGWLSFTAVGYIGQELR